MEYYDFKLKRFVEFVGNEMIKCWKIYFKRVEFRDDWTDFVIFFTLIFATMLPFFFNEKTKNIIQ